MVREQHIILVPVVKIQYQTAPQLLITSLVISDMYKSLSQLISLIVLDAIKIVSLLLVV